MLHLSSWRWVEVLAATHFFRRKRRGIMNIPSVVAELRIRLGVPLVSDASARTDRAGISRSLSATGSTGARMGPRCGGLGLVRILVGVPDEGHHKVEGAAVRPG